MSRHYIISYDIASNKLRTALSKLLLKNACVRIQKSVFLAPNFGKDQLILLQKQIKVFMLNSSFCLPTDSIVCFPVKNTDIGDMVWNGDTENLRKILNDLLFILL